MNDMTSKVHIQKFYRNRFRQISETIPAGSSSDVTSRHTVNPKWELCCVTSSIGVLWPRAGGMLLLTRRQQIRAILLFQEIQTEHLNPQ
jgi:hypothetical protein